MLEEKLPIISVIITLYNRTQFVREAIESVIKQTLNKDLYEIILVSNIPLDTSAYGENLKFSLIPDEQIGKKYLRGLELSKGKIITFLDDDDLFYETRLEKIVNFYKKNSGTIYYHNSFSFISADGKDVKTTFKKHSQKFSQGNRPMVIRNDGKLKKLVKAKKISADFNMSSIAVSRELIIQNSNLLFSSNKTPDIYLFLEAIHQRATIYLDPEKLTKYRLRTETQPKLFTETIKPGHVQLDVRDEIVSIASKSGDKLFLKYSYFERYDYLAFSELKKFKNSRNRNRKKVIDNMKKLPLTKVYLIPYFFKYIFFYIILFIYPEWVKHINI
ncbi:glycosyltransferase [Cuniculiplasma divulgatum]|uniref:Glycosyltransferase n=1 Tax=Cuniculiplasma divulgatum TaxID=1673428 RepID=A0A1N5USZ3_9ARCH|nr:glycosyltransferase [Cuniculiplasma divulgatum]